MLKRGFDVVVSALGLIVLSPVFAICALAVKFGSPGAVLYHTQRIGRYGKPFTLYKFRSMVAGADRMGLAVTGADDTRVTPVGRILRRSKLDELPQLYNVLRGDMSFVGPRPEVARYTALYTDDQRRILDVRPGITSLASIVYRHEEALLVGDSQRREQVYIQEVMPAKLKIDLEYARNPSLAGDIVIIFRTLLALFR
ncbi:MAG: sugar transferase [Chloroflexota bacterium]